MCGIAGIVHSNLDPRATQSAVRYMIALQRHRGPDGEGFYDNAGVSLGHARLSIIDLSENGKQPMSDSTGRFWITFNGEIYNYLELASQLEQAGYYFRSRSDTEVLLYAYIHWGNDCVNYLRGMFAFAIWDENERKLLIARDRLGIKPLHYFLDPHGNLFFSSEIKAILPFVPERKIHAQLASEYIAWNLLDQDDSQTMFENIKRLPPGHTLVWKAGQGIRMSRYWELLVPDKSSLLPSHDPDLFHEFRARFEEVIRLHLRSDVPVGTSLSGGLDSSAIVGLVNKQLRVNGIWKEGWQHAFSACFEEVELDERPYIDEVVRATGIDPHYVFPSGEQLMTDFEDWIWCQEEPVSGTNPYAQFCVSRLAKQFGIKVLLDGQGADEQLAGYRKFILVYLRELMYRRKYLLAIREGLSFSLSPEILRTSRFAQGRRYLFNAPDNASTLWQNNAFPKRPSSLELGYSLVDRLHQDITCSSLPLLLRYEDRNSMAFGIEARVPFVDHELVEWLIRLPPDMRLYHGWTKYILREALPDILPPKIKKRKTKLGFLTPEAKWLSGPLQPWLLDTLQSPIHIQSIVDLAGVRQLLLQYQEGSSSPALFNTLFRLAITEFWARQFLGVKIQSMPLSQGLS
jgi:asparagine synthase (glutamine-hydrolysing)